MTLLIQFLVQDEPLARASGRAVSTRIGARRSPRPARSRSRSRRWRGASAAVRASAGRCGAAEHRRIASRCRRAAGVALGRRPRGTNGLAHVRSSRRSTVAAGASVRPCSTAGAGAYRLAGRAPVGECRFRAVPGTFHATEAWAVLRMRQLASRARLHNGRLGRVCARLTRADRDSAERSRGRTSIAAA